MASASDLVLAAGQRVRDDLVAARIVSPDNVVVVRPGVRDLQRVLVAQARFELGVKSDLPVAGWRLRA